MAVEPHAAAPPALAGRAGVVASPVRSRALGMLVLASLSWGTSAALTKVTLAQLAPTDLFGIEVVASAVPLFLLAVLRGARPFRLAPAVVTLGLLEPGLAYLLFDLGVTRTAASHAALLLAADTPVTLALAVLFLRERVGPALLASLLLGVTGSVLVTWQAGGAGGSVVGDLLVVASTVAAAGYGVLARHVAPDRDVVVVTAVQMGAALVVAVPVFLGSVASGHSEVSTADPAHLALAVVVGLLGGVVPFLLFNRAIADLTASQASLIGVLVPAVAAAISVLLLGDPVTASVAVGGALALAAAALAARQADAEP